MTRLSTLKLGTPGIVSFVDWSALGEREGRRLRELGLIEGAEIEPLHRGSFLSRDPIAVRVGRMDVIIRLAHAATIEVDTDAEGMTCAVPGR